MTGTCLGLGDKPHTRQRVALKTTLRAVATVKRLQQNPELGAWRIHAALKRLGIALSPRTCGRILALNRRLYGLSGPKAHGCQITIAVRDQAPYAIAELSTAPLLPSGSSVDIGGRCLAYTQMGTGSPTVVLEAGWAWGRWSWNWIIQGSAQSTRVIAYDRAGIGESDPVPPAPRSAKHMADDLATLLARGAFPAPMSPLHHRPPPL
jgi:hypothetical protein